MINKELTCNYPCTDVHLNIVIPQPDLDPDKIHLVMISEAPAANYSNYFYRDGLGSFFQTTKMAFEDAGITIGNYQDLTDLGIYLTTAIKCCKKDYLVSNQTIQNCAKILEIELLLFDHLKVIMCMGDFAIKAINFIYKTKYGVKPIKSGSTYKIRQEQHEFNNIRFFPSYTQTGDSFNIEKSKRSMIAEDIKNALEYLKSN